MASTAETSLQSATEVEIRKSARGYKVSFPYHPALVARVARIEGAAFQERDEAWTVPLNQKEALDKAVIDMNTLLAQDMQARTEIERDATAVVRVMMKGEEMEYVSPKISDFHSKERPTVGEIVAANGHWVAQHTGYGRDNNAAFITLHRTASLTKPVFKGDEVAILYDEKGRGQVEPRSPDLSKTMGKEIDGVTVTEKDGVIRISFEFNRDMQSRINRIAGVEFNSEERSYQIDANAKPFVERAVRDMRRIYREDHEASREMEYVASEKMSGAKVIKPFLKDSPAYTGPVVGVNDVFVLQSTGREFFALHRRSDLDVVPRINETVKIQYDHGRAKVQPKVQMRDQGHGR